MIIFLYGLDTYRSRQKLLEFKEKFLREVDPSGMNFHELDGETLTMDVFHSAVSSVSFLARKRMVVVKNCIAKNRSKNLFGEMVEFLKRVNDPDVIILFWECEVAEANPLFVFLKKREYTQEFKLLNTHQVELWIAQEVTLQGGVIERAAITKLAVFASPDLQQLHYEIVKLVSFAHGRIIRTEDVNLLVRAKFDDNIFHCIDSLCSRDIRQFFILIRDQISSGAHELYLLGMLLRQLRLLLILKEAPLPQAVKSKLKVHPYVLQKSMAQARKFSFDELKRFYQGLLAIDMALKTGKGDFLTLLELLVVETMTKV